MFNMPLCHVCEIEMKGMELIDGDGNTIESERDAVAQNYQCTKCKREKIH